MNPDQIPLLEVDPSARRAHDFYETPRHQTEALLARIDLAPGSRVLECCAGRGAIASVVAEDPDCRVYTNEPFEPGPWDFRLDATMAESWQQFPAVDWVISNLPFNVAIQIVPHALMRLRLAPHPRPWGVAMLLRLSWVEPTKDREGFLSHYPPTSMIVLPRHDYRGNGDTDSVTSAWFVWGQRISECEPIQIVTTAERDRYIAEARLRAQRQRQTP